MIIKELIKKLSKLNPELPVLIDGYDVVEDELFFQHIDDIGVHWVVAGEEKDTMCALIYPGSRWEQ